MVTLDITLGNWGLLPAPANLLRQLGLGDGIRTAVATALTALKPFAAAAIPAVFLVLPAPVVAVTPPPPAPAPAPKPATVVPRRFTAEMLAAEFDVGDSGFLPADPVTKLTDPYYSPWETLSADLPSLNRSGQVHAAIKSMPLLDPAKLATTMQRRRAYVILGQLVHSWVHSTKVPWPAEDAHVAAVDTDFNSVPAQLAVPWRRVCATLGLPCILVAAGVDMWNYLKLDPSGPMATKNMSCVSTMTGTGSEIYFHMIPCAIHARFAEGSLPLEIFNVPVHLYRRDPAAIVSTLKMLAAALIDFKTIFQTAKDPATEVSVSGFYDIYRPLLGAFWPDGVTLEGAGPDPDGTAVVRAKGPSAGQSTMFVLFDIMLDVPHAGTTGGATTDASAFQAEMLHGYMPPAHAKMASAFKARMAASNTTLRKFATEQGGDLQAQYDECVQNLRAFRSYHLGAATKYLVRTTKGTGTSTFRDLLKEMIVNTNEAMIGGGDGESSRCGPGELAGIIPTK